MQYQFYKCIQTTTGTSEKNKCLEHLIHFQVVVDKLFKFYEWIRIKYEE